MADLKSNNYIESPSVITDKNEYISGNFNKCGVTRQLYIVRIAFVLLAQSFSIMKIYLID